MRVKRDFAKIYETETDPWGIGAADSPRYELYRDLVLGGTPLRGKMLDIGCGLAAFLARFEDEFAELIGVDVSAEAVHKAQDRFPDARFVQASTTELAETELDGESFDAIVHSDVICYLPEQGRRQALSWVAAHLNRGGVALIAAWTPGGRYLDRDELVSLVRRDFRIDRIVELESGHTAIVAEARRCLVALTFDYETWQPIPPGRKIDWEADVFAPTAALLEALDGAGAKATLFAELGEYFWLQENDAPVAERMEGQWRTAISRGHDVQPHLHPSWLPELGARHENGSWSWDPAYAKAADYPGDLTELIGRCKRTLEDLLRPVDPEYRVTCFRAGGYQAQPFERLWRSLVDNGIRCDSSVFAGGVSAERGYDYSLAWSSGQPYWASATDPQLPAPPSERHVVELPIFTFAPGRRLLLDGDEGPRFARKLLTAFRSAERGRPSSEQLRRRGRVRRAAARAYTAARPVRRVVNLVLPHRAADAIAAYPPDESVGHTYAVGIGHTKGEPAIPAIAAGAAVLGAAGLELVTISELADSAVRELEATIRTPEAEAAYQVDRERGAVLGTERNERQSFHLQDLIPLDRTHVLDLGCGSGDWSARIAELYPWMDVIGVDVGAEFVAAARERHGVPRVSFEQGSFEALPFANERFDCVYADNSLEHAFDVEAALGEAWRVLEHGGVIVAAIPSDARNSRRVCDNHTWKTWPGEIETRFRRAGFVDVEIDEIDTFRRFGMPPFPPARSRMSYVRAWKRDHTVSRLERAREAMDWVYRRLDPAQSSEGSDPVSIIAGGFAFCAGYVAALGALLRREGFDVAWVTMEAANHPRGRGPRSIDTHEVLAVSADGAEVVLDAMTNRCLPHPLRGLLDRPSLAGPRTDADVRYRERGYELYDTGFWYERVTRYRRSRRYLHRLPVWHRR